MKLTPTGPAAGTSVVISRSSMQQAQPFPFSDANQPDVHPLIDSSGSTHRRRSRERFDRVSEPPGDRPFPRFLLVLRWR
jgi:hypothetical protein